MKSLTFCVLIHLSFSLSLSLFFRSHFDTERKQDFSLVRTKGVFDFQCFLLLRSIALTAAAKERERKKERKKERNRERERKNERKKEREALNNPHLLLPRKGKEKKKERSIPLVFVSLVLFGWVCGGREKSPLSVWKKREREKRRRRLLTKKNRDRLYLFLSFLTGLTWHIVRLIRQCLLA